MSCTCEKCQQSISQERVNAFLEFKGILPKTCIDCSEEKKNKGFMDFAHKTAPEICVIDMNQGNSDENLRRAKRVFNRDR